jgi:ClpP class serine protease
LSQCDEVVVAPNGWVGSIGVLMVHYSTAGWEEKQGYQTTITRTPATKAEGAAGESLNKEALASRQEMVDGLYEKFAAAVARGRGVSVAKVKAGFGTAGWSWPTTRRPRAWSIESRRWSRSLAIWALRLRR